MEEIKNEQKGGGGEVKERLSPYLNWQRMTDIRDGNMQVKMIWMEFTVSEANFASSPAQTGSDIYIYNLM